MSENDSELVVPVDDGALNLLVEALDFHWVSVDPDGTHHGSGEFSLHDLLLFWSGYDPAKEELIEGYDNMYEYTGGPVLTHKDVILALIDEVRRLRNDGS